MINEEITRRSWQEKYNIVCLPVVHTAPELYRAIRQEYSAGTLPKIWLLSTHVGTVT